MAIQSSLKNMVLSLGIICLVSSALLAGAYSLTKAPIEAAEKAKQTTSIMAVMPEFAGDPVSGTITLGDKEYNYYVGNDASGNPVGYAIESAGSGFNGPVSVMVGITPDGVIYNTVVLSQGETPGLGAKCVEPAFADQFKGFDPAVKTLKVTKDRGDVVAITASTITSRAYCVAVQTAVDAFKAIIGSAPADATTGATAAEDAAAIESAADSAAAAIEAAPEQVNE